MEIPIPSLVFVDLDGTMLSVSSEKEFLQHLLRRGGLSGWAFVRWMAQYALHPLRSLREGKGWNRTYLKNFRPETAASQARSFSTDFLTGRMRADLLKLLTGWRREGAELVLMTSSLRWLAEPVGSAMGVAEIVASDPEVVNGKLTGRLSSPRPWGKAKRSLAEAITADRGLSAKSCLAAGDSWADRYIMSYCGRALAVNPSASLARLARRKGWPVMQGRHTRWA